MNAALISSASEYCEEQLIPEGSDTDETRKREWHDRMFEYLCEVGVEVI